MKRMLFMVGARPNFMKIAPIMRAMSAEPDQFQQLLVHTGQHYDDNMSKVFFDQLGLARPDVNLNVGSGTHAEQTAQVMLGFEPVLRKFRPDWVVVPGDVNSTLACALTAAKLNIKVAHVEAGLRSFDRSMPEEINRVLTDHISDLLFTTEASARVNLRSEGIADDKIRFVGNVMIDMLIQLLPEAELRWNQWRESLGVERFVLVTLHRPHNVDNPAALAEILKALETISVDVPVVFPVHPRTRQRIAELFGGRSVGTIRLLEPLGYLDFLALQAHATLVLTDSGGVQEETTYLQVRCLTVRPNTERPVTITHGTNRLVSGRRDDLVEAARSSLQAGGSPTLSAAIHPEKWDGRAAQRIVAEFKACTS